MDRATRRLVRQRAGDPCEYCRLPQDALPISPFHIEHIIARQHGGSDDAGNLALSCHHCNLHKGPNLTGIDPDSGEVARLFHPRLDVWSEHFEHRGVILAGLTPLGRATVRTLAMNDADAIEARSDLD